jgi:DNA-binding transcriptional MerR regulator
LKNNPELLYIFNQPGNLMRIQKPTKKLYYSLRQVSEMLGVSDNIIKTWEKEFPRVKPVRNRADNRYFVEKDLAVLFKIKELLLEEKLSFSEARQRLKEFRGKDFKKDNVEIKKLLAEVKMEVREIIEIFNSR